MRAAGRVAVALTVARVDGGASVAQGWLEGFECRGAGGLPLTAGGGPEGLVLIHQSLSAPGLEEPSALARGSISDATCWPRGWRCGGVAPCWRRGLRWSARLGWRWWTAGVVFATMEGSLHFSLWSAPSIRCVGQKRIAAILFYLLGARAELFVGVLPATRAAPLARWRGAQGATPGAQLLVPDRPAPPARAGAAHWRILLRHDGRFSSLQPLGWRHLFAPSRKG